MSKYLSKKLSEIGEIITGNTPSKAKPEYWGGNTLFVKPPNLGTAKIILNTEETLSDLGKSQGKIIKKDSIMVCCIGSLGKIGIAGADLCTNQQINSIYFNPNFVDFKYGYYFCTTLEKRMNKMANKAIIAIINKTSFSKIQIPLPPLSTQSLIVTKLDEAFANIDRQISLLKMNIEDAENMKKSVLEESFQGGEYVAKKLGEIARFIDYRGKTPVKTDSGIPLITAKNIRSGYIDENPREYIAESDYLSWMTRGFPNRGDLAFTTEAPLGNIAEIDLDYKIALAQRVIVFQAKENSYIPGFLKYHILSPSFQKTLFEKGTGTTVKGIKASVLKEITIPIPPLPRQHEIVAHLDAVFDTTQKLRKEYEEQIRDLETMKQSLLEEAFAGRLVEEK